MRNNFDDLIIGPIKETSILFKFPFFDEKDKAMDEPSIVKKRKLSPLRESEVLSNKSQKLT